MSSISSYLATLEPLKDQKTQAIINAFRLLALDLDRIKNAPSTSSLSSNSTSLFHFQELPYSAIITPTYPADARFYATRVSLTGNISAFNTPFNIRTGAVYAAIFETDASPRTVTFSSWYSFIGTATVTIPANSRYSLLMVCTNEGSQGRQIVAFVQSTGGSGASGWVGPSIVPPTTAGTWTSVNGLSISDSAQSTLLLTKSTAGAGWCLKAIPNPASYDLIGAIANVSFGQYDGASPGVTDNVLIETGFCVTNGLLTSSSARGVTHYHYPRATTPSSVQAGILTRGYTPLIGAPFGIFSFLTCGNFLPFGTGSWFRIVGNSSNITLYMGDGVTWVVIGTIPYTASHFGFYINPTGGLTGTALSQTVRVTSCSV
jgi:hypothetical protein